MSSSVEYSLSVTRNSTLNTAFVDQSTDSIEFARNATRTIENCVFDELYVDDEHSVVSKDNTSFNRTFIVESDKDMVTATGNSLAHTAESTSFKRSNSMRKRCKKACNRIISKLLKRTIQAKNPDTQANQVPATTNHYNPYAMNMSFDQPQANFQNFGDIVVWHV
jgi:hypothetical protein